MLRAVRSSWSSMQPRTRCGQSPSAPMGVIYIRAIRTDTCAPLFCPWTIWSHWRRPGSRGLLPPPSAWNTASTPAQAALSRVKRGALLPRLAVNKMRFLWHNVANLNKAICLSRTNAMMETSKLELLCQRPREWCKPGQDSQLKILPEQQI